MTVYFQVIKTTYCPETITGSVQTILCESLGCAPLTVPIERYTPTAEAHEEAIEVYLNALGQTGRFDWRGGLTLGGMVWVLERIQS